MSAADRGRGPHADVAAGVGGPVAIDEVVAARAAWSAVVPAGQTLRIVDLGGNQAVDCLLYNADDLAERYSAADTIVAQRNIFLVAGTSLLLQRGQPDDDDHGHDVRLPRHDRRGLQPGVEHAALRAPHRPPARLRRQLPRRGRAPRASTKRDLVSNINWFMNVPVGADGTLGIVDGISAPGLCVDLRAEMDVLVLISNCPQINNPCNGFDPTPVRVVVIGPAR